MQRKHSTCCNTTPDPVLIILTKRTNGAKDISYNMFKTLIQGEKWECKAYVLCAWEVLDSMPKERGWKKCTHGAKELLVQWKKYLSWMCQPWFYPLMPHMVPWALSGEILECRSRSKFWASLSVASPPTIQVKYLVMTNWINYGVPEILLTWDNWVKNK